MGLGTICYAAVKLLFLSDPDTLKEDLIEIFLGLVVGFLVALVGLFMLAREYKHDNRGVIRREWLLLNALSTDFKNAYKSVDMINQSAHLVWDSGMLNLRDITQKLTTAETEWVKETGDLTFEAKRCTEDAQEDDLNESAVGLMRWLNMAMVRRKIWRELILAFGMERALGAIQKYQGGNGRECANKSVQLLEDTRVRVRTLQDRPIDKGSNQHMQADFRNVQSQPFRAGIALVLLRLISSEERFAIGMEPQIIHAVVMQMQLLRAMVKDLRVVALESEIEKVWLGEANEIVGLAQKEITAFLQEVAYRFQWLSRVTDYLLYRPKFQKVMKNVTAMLTQLHETKERYGFSFIKRGLLGVSLFSVEDHNGDIAITAIMQTKRAIHHAFLDALLKEEPKDCLLTVSSIMNELNDLEKRLTREEQTDGGTHTRAIYFELLRKLYCRLERCVANARWDEVEGIKESVDLLTKCIEVYRIKAMEESSTVVGLEEAKHELVLKLTRRDADRRLPIISIVGMSGVGKTTLVKEMCNHKLVVENFEYRWRFVTLPEGIDNDELKLLQSVGEQIFLSQDPQTVNDRESWISQLTALLRARNFLIVLDNLSTKEAWDFLKPALIPAGTKSTIMITTRYKEVASHANPIWVHHHRLRTADESWELFTQMVNPPSKNPEVMKLAKKVVDRTGGLPLAIMRLGYLLSGKNVTRDDFLVLHERVWQGQNRAPWKANLETNRQDLQPQSVLENCLSYFLMFPIDYKIPRRRLIAMWISQGLIPVHNAQGASESEPAGIEKEYLSELINRNMIQIVERKPNGRVQTCQFPGILRDLWLARPSNNNTARSRVLPSNRKQIAYRFDGSEDGSFSRIIRSLDGNAPNEDNYPLSVTLFDSREGNRPGIDVHSFLAREISSGNFLGLLVLDLEGVFKPQLPAKLGALGQLRYLGLRWTYVETLPPSIGKLSNLQTLDLKKTSLRTLPSSVWKLKKLSHLYLNQCGIKAMPAQIEISMKNLSKLLGVFIDNDSKALMDSLPKLSNLRKLELTFQLTEEKQKMLARNMQKLTNLRSLSLRSVNESTEPQDLKLEHLSNLKNLSSLYLFGKLDNLCVISELPRSLTELTLSSSELSQGSLILQMLSALPELKFLSLFSRSYVDNRLVFSGGGFPKLLHLKLWNLEDLKSLNIEEKALPELREFEIRKCTKMAVPSGLTDITSLQLLKLTYMCQDYTKCVEESFARAKRQSPERIFPIIRITPNEEEPVVCEAQLLLSGRAQI